MSGLREIAAFIESREPSDILGDDPRSWRGTPQAAELAKRWEAVESACKWIESLGDYKLKKSLGRSSRSSEAENEFPTDLPRPAARRRK